MALSQTHWRDRAITTSEKITDGWEVVKSYLARIAEPVLFVMMVANIIEMLPGVTVWPWFSALVLGIQAVSLDVAGFGLNTMADHARRAGNEKAATKAERTGWLLIGIMIATLLAVATGMLFPQVVWILVYIEKALILIRVALTVWYGYVIHGLRSSDHTVVTAPVPVQSAPDYEQLEARLQEKIAQLESQLAILVTEKSAPDSAPQSDTQATQNPPEDDTDRDTDTAIPCAPNITLLRSSKRSKSRTGSDPEKAAKAKRYIARNPQISATTLAQKAGISPSYARKLLAEYREHVVNN